MATDDELDGMTPAELEAELVREFKMMTTEGQTRMLGAMGLAFLEATHGALLKIENRGICILMARDGAKPFLPAAYNALMKLFTQTTALEVTEESPPN